ncbi:Peptide deformylase 1 [bacterium HR20]|nr:Peptide deformylase 1 [bacterium HR20]
MILPIYLYNHPVLRRPAQPVPSVNDEIISLAENMFETMRNANGIGLAANQVGQPHAMIVVDISDVEDGERTPPLCLLNPRIIAASDAMEEYEEGCLSVPGIREIVVRPAAVTVEYDDLELHHHRIEAEGLLARVLQHETDHLSGVYFFERISPMRRTLLKSKLKKLERGSGIECSYPFVHPLVQKITAP